MWFFVLFVVLEVVIFWYKSGLYYLVPEVVIAGNSCSQWYCFLALLSIFDLFTIQVGTYVDSYLTSLCFVVLFSCPWFVSLLLLLFSFVVISIFILFWFYSFLFCSILFCSFSFYMLPYFFCILVLPFWFAFF